MVGSDEVAGHGSKVTIKYGKGYEETWVVFSGTLSEIRADLCTYFGVDPEGPSKDLVLSDLVVNCTNLAHGLGNAAAMLGATVISSGTGDASQEAQGDVWAAARDGQSDKPAEPEVDPHAAHFAAVESVTTVDDLKRYWAENQGAFTHAPLMDAYKAKGKALKAAVAE